MRCLFRHVRYYEVMRYIVLNKILGQTPLQALETWKLEHPTYKDIPTTYAGRLDPMATGKLLVLLGEECKNQEKYRDLDKEYEIEVLLDFSTDTGDVLGMPLYSGKQTRPSVEQIQQVLQREAGTKTVSYPAFSSKTVNGKPLFLYALQGTLDTISIPSHEETIHRIVFKGLRKIDKSELLEKIVQILSRAPRSNEPSKELGADFRQDAIRDAWRTGLSGVENQTFLVLSLRVTCGSGSYMRSLAERIGNELSTRAIALSIHRTKIGTHTKLFGVPFWSRML